MTLAGAIKNQLRMEDKEEESVKENDLVVSSSLGGSFLRPCVTLTRQKKNIPQLISR